MLLKTRGFLRVFALVMQDAKVKTLATATATTKLIGDVEWLAVKENTAEVLFPNKNEVFYNPVQEFNRDLSIAVLRLQAEDYCTGVLKKKKWPDDKFLSNEEFRQLKFGEKYENGFKILEALAASGLRSIRFAKELRGVREIVANDLSSHAVESIQRNVEHNGVGHLVTPSCGDATMLMYSSRGYKDRFDVIDLDPYGSPTMFLDAAVQSIADGGLLLVTCTDMAILCGNTPEKCRASYGATSLKTKACHEWALRIVLQSLEAAANKYGRYIQPLLSLSIDFYCRLFVRVFTGQAQCKMSASKVGMAYQCSYCESTWIQPVISVARGLPSPVCRAPIGPPVGNKCVHCDSSLHFGGPFWTAPLHDKNFVDRLLNSILEEESSDVECDHAFGTKERMVGMLSVVSEELEDVPGYYSIDRISSVMKVRVPGFLDFRSAILNAGYKVSVSHACKTAIKTDAPAEVIWDLMRCWEKQNPANREKLDPSANAACLKLLNREPKIEADFTVREDANPDSRKSKLTRFPENPAPFWGPKTRAKTGILGASVEQEKSRKNQGKRTQPKLEDDIQDNDVQMKKLKIPEDPASA